MNRIQVYEFHDTAVASRLGLEKCFLVAARAAT